MKNLIIVFMTCFMLFACSDAVDLSSIKGTSIDNDALQNLNGVSTLDIGPVNPYVWTRLQDPTLTNYANNKPDEEHLMFPVNGEMYCLVGEYNEFVYKFNNNTKRWDYFADPHHMYMSFYPYGRYLFSYQSKFYYGMPVTDELDDPGFMRSFDPLTGESLSRSPFPGTPVYNPTCFVIGSKGYLMGGSSKTNYAVNQFWEYDFITDQWTNKGGLPGGARAGGNAFVLNNKVYFGLGYDIIYVNNQRIVRYKKDWYEMDPTGSVAAVKLDFPGDKRTYAKGFVINSKICLGYGKNSNGVYLKDFWEYNPSNNSWTQKADGPFVGTGLNNVNVFAIGNTGYVVKGWLDQFWRYSNSSLVPVP